MTDTKNLNESEKISILFKNLLGTVSTNNNIEFFEEL